MEDSCYGGSLHTSDQNMEDSCDGASLHTLRSEVAAIAPQKSILKMCLSFYPILVIICSQIEYDMAIYDMI